MRVNPQSHHVKWLRVRLFLTQKHKGRSRGPISTTQSCSWCPPGILIIMLAHSNGFEAMGRKLNIMQHNIKRHDGQGGEASISSVEGPRLQSLPSHWYAGGYLVGWLAPWYDVIAGSCLPGYGILWQNETASSICLFKYVKIVITSPSARQRFVVRQVSDVENTNHYLVHCISLLFWTSSSSVSSSSSSSCSSSSLLLLRSQQELIHHFGWDLCDRFSFLSSQP